LAGTVRLRLSDCLGVCEQSNVIVIQPSVTGRAAGGRPCWLGLVLDLEVIADIAAWITAGGPGLAEPPDVLDLYEFQPSRRIRKDAGFDKTSGA
jgi:(2Fe-2S) ferredoxin